MRWLLFLVAFVLMLWFLMRRRPAQRSAPALKLAGGPPDEAEDAAAGRPLFDAIVTALRAHGSEVAAVEPDDWGYAAKATVDGEALKLRLGAHGSNGVGRIWLLELEGAGPGAAQVVERAVGSIEGVKLLGWDE
jgi:hypothetical protein